MMAELAYCLYLGFGVYKLLIQSFDDALNTLKPAKQFLLGFKNLDCKMKQNATFTHLFYLYLING